jgi:hypothetical protein
MSASAVNTYWSCPYRYYLKYVQLLPDEDNERARRGRILHQVFDDVYDTYTPEKVKRLMESDVVGIPMQRSALYTSMLQTMAQLLDLDHKADDPDYAIYDASIQSFSLMNVQVARTIAVDGLTTSRIEDMWFPTSRELFVEDEKNKLYGYIDQTRHDTDGSLMLLDYKVKGSTHPTKTVSQPWKLQAAHYTVCWMSSMEEETCPKFYFVLPNVKYGNMPHVYDTTAKTVSRNAYVARVNKTRRAIDSGFFPKRCENDMVVGKDRDGDISIRPVEGAKQIFTKYRVCAFCPYTMECLGMSAEELSNDVKLAFKEAVEGNDRSIPEEE